MSDSVMLVQPVADRQVMNPATMRHLPHGRPSRVPQTSYWLRRERDGSIFRCSDPEVVEVAEAEEPTTTPEPAADAETPAQPQRARRSRRAKKG